MNTRHPAAHGPTIALPSGRRVGAGQPTFIVAEIGQNHQGRLETAALLVKAAHAAGADAVKFQKRDPTALFTRAGLDAPYAGPHSFGPTYGLHRAALELSTADLAVLKALAESLGLVFFASVWDPPSLDDMVGLGAPIIKIGSADLVNLPLLRRAGATGLPLFLSTGMSPTQDVDTAVAVLSGYHRDIALLHCVSRYPCPDEGVALPAMDLLAARHGLVTGYSGHERGLGPSVAAVARGAAIIERHFTLDKSLPGTDHQASLDPGQLTLLVGLCREVEAALSVRRREVHPEEEMAARKLRKSLVFARDLPGGHVLGEKDLASKCPGTGIPPLYWDAMIGRVLTCPVRHDQEIRWSMLVPTAPAEPAATDEVPALALAATKP